MRSSIARSSVVFLVAIYLALAALLLLAFFPSPAYARAKGSRDKSAPEQSQPPTAEEPEEEEPAVPLEEDETAPVEEEPAPEAEATPTEDAASPQEESLPDVDSFTDDLDLLPSEEPDSTIEDTSPPLLETATEEPALTMTVEDSIIDEIYLEDEHGNPLSMEEAVVYRDIWVQLETALESILNGDTSTARALVEPRLGADYDTETEAMNHYLLGLCDLYELDFASARAHFLQVDAIAGKVWPGEMGPEYAAHCLYLQQDYSGAIAEYEAIASDSSASMEFRAGARYKVGEILYDLERYEEALGHFKRVPEEFPSSSWIGVSQIMIGDLETYLARQSE